MTLRKIHLLYLEHKKEIGEIEKEQTIEDL